MDARQARRLHEDRLMRLAHVTGVGIGRDENSGEDVIVVFVTHEVPRDRLRPEDVIPDELEGVPVRVLSMGDGETQDDTQSETKAEAKGEAQGKAKGETEQEQSQRGP